MKTNNIAALSAALSALALAPAAFGQLYYDANNSGAGTGATLVTNNWLSSGGQANRVWATVATGITGGANSAHWDNATNANTEAVFGGTAGIVTVNDVVSVGSISFTTTGYTIGGSSALTVAGNITTGTGIAATISAPLSGSVTKTGAGTLTLSGNRTGSTTVIGGKLTISTPAALHSTSAVQIDSGATLALGSGGSYSADTLTLGSGGGTIDFNAITGALTFAGYSGTGVVDVVNYTHSGSSFIRFTGVIAGLTNSFTIGGEAAAFAANGDLILASAIPEPSSVALLGALGALGFAATRRRRSVQA